VITTWRTVAARVPASTRKPTRVILLSHSSSRLTPIYASLSLNKRKLVSK
jgi:hypothetical protein